ncbi:MULTISPECIES: isopentenyl-diphosphate Delta-isomerase [unclassified Phycicoccus]|uniref:isopentenyl-diphosphate Delta-isomerase n=1 Tax=unclassified Phycicoccus TaxID=2637926 RepID=UPI000A9447BC|nr:MULTISPECIES: isopentenyl-diphosphate Delta-isomerase [unclassified Phycicoccus]
MTTGASRPTSTTDSTMEELVVLLDDEGRAVGTAPKATVHTADTPLHLAFSAYVFGSDGHLLLTRRALDKPTFPGIWTNSVCGHPAPGEDLAEAVRRRALQELGAIVTGVRLVLPGFGYRAEMDGVVEHELCPVYAAWLAPGERLRLDASEVHEATWVGWHEVCEEVRFGLRAVSPWCARQLRLLEALGPDPRRWSEGDAALLPPAARTVGG